MRKDYNLEKRKYIIGGFIVVIAIIYIARLFMLQIVDTDYRRFAEGNAFLKKVQYPSRGLIYDREGRLMVYNQSAYDVMMIPREVKEFDTLAFCNAIDITKEEFDQRVKRMKDRRYNPSYSSHVCLRQWYGSSAFHTRCPCLPWLLRWPSRRANAEA